MTATWLPDAAPSTTLAEVRSRVAAGVAPGDLRHLPPRVRRAVTLAVAVGAPVLPALDAAGAALDDERRTRQALRVATAQARAVAAGLVALPALLVPALGRLLGLDLVAFYGTGTGLVVAAVAAVLVVAGGVLVLLLVRRAARPASRAGGGAAPLLLAAVAGLAAGPWAAAGVGLAALAWARSRRPRAGTPDEPVDLVATGLAGGLGIAEALRAVADLGVGPAAELRRMALALDLGHPLPPGPMAPLAAVVRATSGWGAPAVPTLRALARDLRADALADALAAAERLPAQLTFPTALCLLPASVLLIGAPLVVDGLAAAGAG